MVQKRRSISDKVFGLVIACGVCGGALAFAAGMGVDNFSQLATGNESDIQCMGSPKDAHCQCNKGIDKKTGKCGNVPGGGKIGCPCKDVTSGFPTDGKCAAVGKCKGESTGGMMPMLPMLPMPMPKMSMPMMMQPNCPPKNNSNATTSTSTVNAARTAADTGGGYDPSCPPESFGAQSGGNFWGSVWDNVNPFASPDDSGDDTGTDDGDDTGTTNTNSVWGNLMKSLGISNDSGDDTDTGTGTGTGTNTGSSTTTGGVTSKTGTSTTASTTTTQTTIDFAKSGSTFTYEAGDDEFDTQAATVLDQIKKTLEKLLDIVSKWL
jgi:hypothetical protein